MRIAFTIINANRREGTSRAILEVAERLGVEHDVDLWARTVEDVDLSRVNWIEVRGPRRPEVGDFASFKWLVDRSIERYDYDIIHSPGPNTSKADVYAIQTVHPVKMHQMSIVNADASAGWARRISHKTYDNFVVSAERESYKYESSRGPRAFLPVSLGTKQELLSTYPDAQHPSAYSPEATSTVLNPRIPNGNPPRCKPHDNVVVIPNGANLQRFSPSNKELHRADVRRDHDIHEDDFVVLFSGGDWRRKGLDLLLQAFAKFDTKTIKLLVVGHDRAGASVKQMSQQLGLSERVRFAGFRTDVHRYYAAGDLFVFPTAYEAFSLATIEAAAAGLPVLMPDVSGAEELVGSGKTGQIITRNPHDLAETIKEYVASPKRVTREGTAARQLVEREFSWDVIANKTMAVYTDLLRRRAELLESSGAHKHAF